MKHWTVYISNLFRLRSLIQYICFFFSFRIHRRTVYIQVPTATMCNMYINKLQTNSNWKFNKIKKIFFYLILYVDL